MADHIYGSSYDAFIASSIAQLKDKVPEIYWEALHRKLENEIYDAGEKFSILLNEEDGTYHVTVTHENGVQASDPNSIFLIDHAWMYEREYAKTHLDTIPDLAERMSAIMGIKVELDDEYTKEQRRDEILEKMWCFNQTFRMGMVGHQGDELVDVSSTEDRSISQWYVLDEFGTRIQHSDEPTCQTMLFYHIPVGLSFTLIWPSRDLDYEEELTRDYQPGVQDPYLRKFHLFPWQQCDVDQEIEKHAKEMEGKEKTKLNYKEILPEGIPSLQREPENGIYKVYTNNGQVQQFLTDPRFKLVDNKYDADILWLMEHIKDYRTLEERGQMVNQYPFDFVLTCKDELAAVCQRSGLKHEEFKTLEDDELLCRGPYWLPVTYNLNTELPEFIQHFKRREKRGLDNHWLAKPWNMGRGLDLHVTDNLNHLIRMAETGPKIASKYIDKQVLFYREDVGNVKFDLRYHLYLCSVDPIELYVEKIFWTRFANKEFGLEDLEDYEKHFTVMNYRKTELKQIHHDQFKKMWDEQYPDYKYENIERELFKMFKEIIQAAVKDPPPYGLGNYKHSRAFFGLDIMLKWADDGSKRMVPQILEFNFLPDCARVCRYYPDFFNFMFSLMFLGDSYGWDVERLL